MKYNAFISYSHAQDSDLAPSLERALEKFAKPLLKQKALRIFRDANDLSASPDLWGKIEEGLRASDYFIFFASPKAAQSKWCKKEVEFWKAHKEISKFLIVLTDGDLHWDDETSDFDWSKTTAIPENLSGMFKNEPLFVDFRNHKNDELTLEHSDFRSKTVLLAATIHGKSVGNMIGENMKQHKKTLRIRNGVILILSMLVIAAGISSYIAFQEKNRAEEQTEFAKDQTKIADDKTKLANEQTLIAKRETNKALLLSYIAMSKSKLDQDPTIALRLAEHAYKFAVIHNLPKQSATEQLIKVYYSGNGFYLDSINETPNYFPKSVSRFEDVRIEDLSSPRNFDEKLRFKFLEIDKMNNVLYTYRFEYSHYNPKFSKDGKYILFDTSSGLIPTMNIYKRQTDSIILELFGFDEGVYPNYDTGRNPINGHYFMLVSSGDLKTPQIHYDLHGNGEFKILDIDIDGFSGHNSYINDVAISPNAKYSVLGSKNGKTIVLENQFNGVWGESKIEKSKVRILKNSRQSTIANVHFSEDGNYIFTQSFYSWKMENSVKYVKDSIQVIWKTEQFPFIRISNFKDASNSEKRHDFTIELPEGVDSYFAYPDTLKLKDGNNKLLGKFPGRFKRINTDENSPFKVRAKGVFNKSGELLIDIDLFMHDNAENYFSLSTNNKFLLVFEYYSQRIYSLDPDFIINRINDKTISGSIYRLSEMEKEEFNILPLETIK